MSPIPAVDQHVVTVVRQLQLDQDYLRSVITRLTAIGSSALGFRNTGTPEDVAVAEYVAEQMRTIGLRDVAIEPVEVDGWRFLDASVTVGAVTVGAGGTNSGALPTGHAASSAHVTYRAVSFGGVPATPADGLTAHLVDVGEGRRTLLDSCKLDGALVLLDWGNPAVHPSVVVLELQQRGVVGVIVNCPTRGPWYQTSDAVGAFDGHWPAGAPPMVLISKEDATALRSTAIGATVTMTLRVELQRQAAGLNVVGYLPGELPGPIVVGAHHDAWFQGAFDNTSGVAVMLGMAAALASAGHRPRHTICFTSRTAEEYGITDSTYDWCIGAWRQVEVTHPDWAQNAPFHLCVEASGHRTLRSVIEAPVELVTWSRRIGRVAEREGWTPTGWRVAPPVAGTEQWPFLVAGIPGVACYAWEKSFGSTDYHTQFDTIDLLDFDVLTAQARFYLLTLLSADQDPDAILDHSARARALARVATATAHAGLDDAAAQHQQAHGRGAFTAVGQGQFALDAHSEACLPHEQAQRDVRAITRAMAAYDGGNPRGAARALRQVGSHHLHPYLGETAFAAHTARFTLEAVSRTWAGRSHLTPSVDLWVLISTLLAEPGAATDGSWVRAAMTDALAHTRVLLDQRLDAMARSVTAHSLTQLR